MRVPEPPASTAVATLPWWHRRRSWAAIAAVVAVLAVVWAAADIMRYQGGADEMFGDMPRGSLARFTLDGDRAYVYLAEATLVGSNP